MADPSQSGRARRVRAIFDSAMEEPSARRPAFLDANCGGDPALRAEVEALLQARESAGEFLVQAAWRPAPVWQAAPGARLGIYEITGELGAGGMGSVFVAQRADRVYGRKAAIKILRPECRAPGYIKRFQREIRILAKLDHPHVVRIVDAGVAPDGAPFLVMDLIQGQHLDAYCKESGQSLRSHLQLFVKVCHAVAYLHENGILHRDLKPSNILVTREGVPKLVDFGIAMVTGDDPGFTHTTGSMVLFTPGYASPEQARREPLTPASDVYSLGAILYEMVTGIRPYKADGPLRGLAALADAASRGQPAAASSRISRPFVGEPPRTLRKALEGDLDNILLQTLSAAPADRYATAAELARDIERYLRRETVAAVRRGPVMRGSQLFLRSQRMAAAILVAAAGLTLGVGEHLRARRLDEMRVTAEKREREARQMIAELWRDAPPRVITPRVTAAVGRISGPWKDALRDAARYSQEGSSSRTQLLDDGISYLDAARQGGEQDPALLGEIAWAYANLSELTGSEVVAPAGRREQLIRKAESIAAGIAPGARKDAIERKLREIRSRPRP